MYSINFGAYLMVYYILTLGFVMEVLGLVAMASRPVRIFIPSGSPIGIMPPGGTVFVLGFILLVILSAIFSFAG
jgi:hypothetical protein